MSPILRTVRDQVRPADFDRLVGILEDGGVAVVPTDTVYGLIGKAFDARVFDRLDTIKGERRKPYASIFPNLEMIEDWAGGLSIRQRRLASTLFPGPVTLVLNTTGKFPQLFRHKAAGVAVRVSSDSLVPKLAEKLGFPIWASSANRSGDSAPSDFRSVNRALVQAVDMAIDSGPTIFHDASTVIDLRSREFTISRQGPWISRVEKAVTHSDDPLEVMTLCSGNICRSPIAAALLQRELEPAIASKISLSSVGLDALPDLPASREMVEIAHGWGIDLGAHLARKVTMDLLRSADIILAATPQHRNRVIQIEPRATRKTYLISELIDEPSIPDPYERGGDEYLRVAEMIQRAMKAWAAKLSEIVEQEFGTSPGQAKKSAEAQEFLEEG